MSTTSRRRWRCSRTSCRRSRGVRETTTSEIRGARSREWAGFRKTIVSRAGEELGAVETPRGERCMPGEEFPHTPGRRDGCSPSLSREQGYARFRLPGSDAPPSTPHDAFARREESIRRVAVASSQVPVTPVLSDPEKEKEGKGDRGSIFGLESLALSWHPPRVPAAIKRGDAINLYLFLLTQSHPRSVVDSRDCGWVGRGPTEGGRPTSGPPTWSAASPRPLISWGGDGTGPVGRPTDPPKPSPLSTTRSCSLARERARLRCLAQNLSIACGNSTGPAASARMASARWLCRLAAKTLSTRS
jgi:hypothetical protein